VTMAVSVRNVTVSSLRRACTPQTSPSLIAGIWLADAASAGPVSHADIAHALLVDVCVDGGQNYRLLGPCG
jgi:hypothetical protein